MRKLTITGMTFAGAVWLIGAVAVVVFLRWLGVGP